MPVRWWSSAGVKFFKLEYGEVLKALAKYAEWAVGRGARAVVLVGSLARGDYTAFSDADVVIIVDAAPPNRLERIVEFIDPSVPIDVEPRVYTMAEFLKMAGECRRVVREVIDYGKVLAGDPQVGGEAGVVEMWLFIGRCCLCVFLCLVCLWLF